MLTFKINHPDVPGYLNVVAENNEVAEAIFDDWFYARFGRSPKKFLIEDISKTLLLAAQLHRGIAASKRPGVVYAVEEGVWVVLPPDIEAPGPYRLSAQSVQCYKFSKTAGEPGVHVFAATVGDAWQIYHVWAREHKPQTTRNDEMQIFHPNDIILEDARLAKAASLGATGVVSMRLGSWDVLPPWDEAAGAIL